MSRSLRALCEMIRNEPSSACGPTLCRETAVRQQDHATFVAVVTQQLVVLVAADGELQQQRAVFGSLEERAIGRLVEKRHLLATAARLVDAVQLRRVAELRLDQDALAVGRPAAEAGVADALVLPELIHQRLRHGRDAGDVHRRRTVRIVFSGEGRRGGGGGEDHKTSQSGCFEHGGTAEKGGGRVFGV